MDPIDDIGTLAALEAVDRLGSEESSDGWTNRLRSACGWSTPRQRRPATGPLVWLWIEVAVVKDLDCAGPSPVSLLG